MLPAYHASVGKQTYKQVSIIRSFTKEETFRTNEINPS